ncbi:ATP synthase A chain [Roseomonas mucosa]|uniref:ATP synthase subunit a n=1 Tax=Roseomonas mucosa TaxID=207340 RepID=A0A1S8D7D3_9PROT|nr:MULTISPECIES: F0F1 ATP synthase subunit A [Roseomonas]MBS5902962.1 F0F1 ATP synthase subunit A [Acetobacteraceae bacterium]ATR22644.1 F0F1 ATP synthase subunit A [Roseomonas sp. FDAARGOS_362]AWV24350.1 ATP synthase A chain [Roseomonas mucosa]MCG7351027.1 F0F1 ATP synthase subunit A [Roseomonas mucosa]MCG7356461.1 F0F1 ATP synthase subunit A [Roseomonas mucosa]
MATEGKTIDALSQFELIPVLGPVGRAVGFTQSTAHMLLAVGLISALMLFGMRRRAVVPGRLQALAEIFYEFVEGLVIGQVGQEGRRYFPFVFALFMFILFGNMLGLFPYAFTYTSHIAVTFGLAVLVFLTTTIIALVLHGRKFFGYFFPEGAPLWLAPIIIPVEIVSYLSRPISLSIRLFANMVAGHVMLKVFATFVVLIGSFGALGFLGALLPMAVNVALIGFEVLVAFLQAYVFAILTSIYLHDAVHLH